MVVKLKAVIFWSYMIFRKMKVSKWFICWILPIVSSDSWAQEYHLAQRYFTVPVIKQKSFVSMVRVKINVPENDTLDSYLTQFNVSTTGSSNPSEILGIRAYCNIDSNYLGEERIFQSALFSTLEKSSSDTLVLKGNLRLKPGDNYLWVGVALKPSAVNGNKIVLSVTRIQINNRSVAIPTYGIRQPARIATAVRVAMQDNVHTSRIPGMARAKNGDLLAVFDARYHAGRDLQGDIDIALCRSTDRGDTWQPIQRVIDMGRWGSLPEKFNGVSDACILVDDKTGNIFIAGLWMHGVLDDNGKWIEGLRIPVKFGTINGGTRVRSQALNPSKPHNSLSLKAMTMAKHGASRST